MAFKRFVNRTRGGLTVTIGPKTLTLSGALTTMLGETERVALWYDAEKRLMAISPSTDASDPKLSKQPRSAWGTVTNGAFNRLIGILGRFAVRPEGTTPDGQPMFVADLTKPIGGPGDLK